jgi:hypothetical protein
VTYRYYALYLFPGGVREVLGSEGRIDGPQRTNLGVCRDFMLCFVDG